VDLHHLLLAGLPAHAKRYPSMPENVTMGIASLHPSCTLLAFGASLLDVDWQYGPIRRESPNPSVP